MASYRDYKNVVPASAGDDNYRNFQKIARPQRRGWFWMIVGAIVIVLVVLFLIAVYGEVAARDRQLKYILQTAQTGNTVSVMDNSLIGDLSARLDSASSTAVVSEATSGVDVVGFKDHVRATAEKLNRPHLGNPASKLVIVEFADFQCPVCLEEFPTIRTLTNKYGKDLLFIFRNYPIKGDNSTMLAQAGLCADEQGKFWPFHDRVFASQGQLANLDDFRKVATMSGLNWNKLQDCVNKGKYKQQVLEDTSDALDLGVQGTPTFFINGNKLEGAVTMDVWDQIVAKYKELNK